MMLKGTKIIRMTTFRGPLCFLAGATLAGVTGSFAAPEYRDMGGTRTYAPFGFERAQPPPPSSVVSVGPFSLGIEARQVCGYTDWSSLQIHLPKKLMSKQYWDKIGGDLKNAAIQTVTNLSFALPGMLACNISPTFCEIYNQAEILAQWEGSFSVDQCKMLEHVANNTVMNETMRNCMKGYEGLISTSEAREKCITDGARNDTSPLGKTANVLKNAKAKFFETNDLFKAICPESETSSPYYRSAFESGGHAYTRARRACKFAKEIFPGITVNASGRFEQAGTFQSTIEGLKARYEKQAADDLLVVVNAMYREYLGSAKTVADVIAAPSVAKSWETFLRPGGPAQTNIPMYLRAGDEGVMPRFLITPSQMFLLARAVDPKKGVDNEYKDAASPFRNSLDALAMSASYIHLVDDFSSLRLRAEKGCETNLMSSDLAQMNCEAFKKYLDVQLDVLEKRRTAEENFFARQAQVSSAVDAEIQRQERRRIEGDKNATRSSAPLPLPGGL